MKPEELPTADFHTDKNDMSYWFPRLKEADVPIPETYEIEIEDIDRENEEFIYDLDKAERIVSGWGGDAFLRSGYKSAQVSPEGGIIRTVHDIDSAIEELFFQHMMMSMPTGGSVWFRELLDLEHCHYCQGNLVPECRVFIRDGEVVCHHPRLETDFDRAPDHHRETAEQWIEAAWDPDPPPEYADWENEDLKEYAQRVADVFEGNWSVDFVQDINGDWWCTDMAVDALYDLSEHHGEEGWETISDHPGDCENDWRTELDEEYRRE